MDTSGIVELVSNVAFPIAAFVMMFYFCMKTVEDMRKTIENNTQILTKLDEKLDGITKGGEQ